MTPREIVKKEQEEYQQMVQANLDQTEKEVQVKDNLIPANETASRRVNKLMEDYYPPEVLEHMKITEQDALLLHKGLQKFGKSLLKASGAMICLGPKCTMCDRCPFFKCKTAPIGHSCMLELMMIDQYEKEYLDDLDIDTQSKIELDLVRDLIEADLIDWRTSNFLSKDGLFDFNAIGIDANGNAVLQKQESVALSIKLKMKARKDRLREDLLATRKIRAKMGMKMPNDPSKMAGDLNARFKQVKEAQIEDAKVEPEVKNAST